jgi:DNA-binding response OmpR family regulator
MNILIVDKDPLFTTAMSSILRNENYHVSVAKDGKEAAKALDANTYGLVIIDMLMSYTNGLEVVNNIRQNTYTRDTPVMVVSSIANKESMSNWKVVGANAYMEKPLNISALLQKVSELSLKRTAYAA